LIILNDIKILAKIKLKFAIFEIFNKIDVRDRRGRRWPRGDLGRLMPPFIIKSPL